MKTTLKLTTFAAMLFCAAAANAQSTVQISGLVDTYVGSMKMAGDATRQTAINSGGLTTSWFEWQEKYWRQLHLFWRPGNPYRLL